MQIDLENLEFEQGGALLVKRALRSVGDGEEISVVGKSPELSVQLRAWCRMEGHKFRLSASDGGHAIVVKGQAATQRWSGAERAGNPNHFSSGAVAEHPPQRWGLAARGAVVEAGSPEFNFVLADKVEVWSTDAARIYAQATANQWDPQSAIPWHTPVNLPDDVEDAVVQIMTYLVENETAALIIPSRFVAQIHPHFREIMQVLAVPGG